MPRTGKQCDAAAWPGRLALGVSLGVYLAAILLASPGHAQPNRRGRAEPDRVAPGALCVEAVSVAERRHGLPPGLLFAISQVESGRPDPATRRREPWPWTVQAADQSLYFDSKTQAVQWVRDAMARGITSIDTGCLQVNLFFHPRAFETIDDAFDPRRNADYAARFLLQLHAATGDWRQATGSYHSQTVALAAPYQARVERALSDAALPWPAPRKPPTTLSTLSQAWRATTGPDDPAPAGIRRETTGACCFAQYPALPDQGFRQMAQGDRFISAGSDGPGSLCCPHYIRGQL